MTEIDIELNVFVKDLSLDFVNKPAEGILYDALNLDLSALDTVETKTLLKYIVALGQYVIFLKTQENLKKAVLANLTKVFDHKIAEAMFTAKDLYPGFSKRTVKEKQAFAMGNDGELENLHKVLLKAGLEYKVLEGITKPVEEYIQVLKRVLDVSINTK
jgi:hypothetical protein